MANDQKQKDKSDLTEYDFMRHLIDLAEEENLIAQCLIKTFFKLHHNIVIELEKMSKERGVITTFDVDSLVAQEMKALAENTLFAVEKFKELNKADTETLVH